MVGDAKEIFKLDLIDTFVFLSRWVKMMSKIGINVLVEISKEIRNAVRPFLGSSEGGRIVGISFGEDHTRLIDQIAEESVVKYLKRNGISCILIGEEGGVQEIGENPKRYLIVDAIDGTTNAVRGIGFASSALAFASKDNLKDIKAAAVMNLFSGELYVAERNKGAWRNGKRITTSKTLDLKNSVISVDLSPITERVSTIIPVMKTARRVRSLGSASLEICYVASGMLDAHLDMRGMIRTFDFAAAMLILQEAGGVFDLLEVDDKDEIPLTRLRRFSIIAAANRELHSQIISLIQNCNS